MAHVIDLKQKKDEPKPEIPKPDPVISHPVVKEQAVITDSGERLKFQTLRWTAPSTYRREGNRVPYVLIALLLLLGVFVALVQHDVIFTILLGLMVLMGIVHVRKPMAYIAVEVNPLNIRIDNRSYSFDKIKSFWIQYEPEYGIQELSLQFKKWYMPYLKIQIGDQDPVQMRSILIQFIPEAEHEETFVHTLIRRLGL